MFTYSFSNEILIPVYHHSVPPSDISTSAGQSMTARTKETRFQTDMKTNDGVLQGELTRRQMIGGTASALAALTVVASMKAEASEPQQGSAQLQSGRPATEMKFTGEYNIPPKPVKKIALEEHFCTPSMLYLAKDMDKSIAPEQMAYYKKRLLDFDTLRIEEMDKYGIGQVPSQTDAGSMLACMGASVCVSLTFIRPASGRVGTAGRDYRELTSSWTSESLPLGISINRVSVLGE